MTVPAVFDLTGRVALVTGAGSPEGIGLATARLLGELGAAVAVTATTRRARERAQELDKVRRGVARAGRRPHRRGRGTAGGGRRDCGTRCSDGAVLPGMTASGWGRVVMVTSVTGPVTAMRGEVGYAAGKAGMVAFLCSPGASYVTGQCLVVDGGNQVAEERSG